MANDDISRSAYYPQKRYAGVRMQQGRVLTDDDFNEQEVLNHEDKRLMRKDVIGVAGSPDKGFSISEADDENDIDFQINKGVFYIGGLRAELHENQQYKQQKDWLQNPGTKPPNGERQDMAYLEIWQQIVSAVEDEELFETALGGPDTTTRRRTMCRVHINENVKTSYCTEAWNKVKKRIEKNIGGKFQENHALKSDAKLKVEYDTDGINESLCAPSTITGYLGAENQTIRVQLIDKDHFNWCFDNGTPLYRVKLEDAASDRKTIKLLTEPKDQAHWPKAGQIVEIIPWSAVLENGEKLAGELEERHFSTLESSYKPSTYEVTLNTPLVESFGNQWEKRDDADELRKTRFGKENLNQHGYFFMRVWDRGAETKNDLKIAFNNTPINLGTTGLKITISGKHRLPGDHWIISARPHTPDQVQPWELEVSRSTEGYQRFYAPLAIIHWNSPNTGKHVIYDCRRSFRPITDQNLCCTYTVGDGVKSRGDFSSLVEAINHLPFEGGRICVLPGVHHANVRIVNRHNIHITGCKRQSIVHPTEKGANHPIIALVSCENIRIDDLTLVTHTGKAIKIVDDNKFKDTSTGIHIEMNYIFALNHAILAKTNNQIAGNNDIRIINNEIAMLDKEKAGVAIFTEADDVLIDNNRIVVIPALNKEPVDTNDPHAPIWAIVDPCIVGSHFYPKRTFMLNLVTAIFGYMQKTWSNVYVSHQYLAEGGIQIGGGSEYVRIKNNQIVGGSGNGITLGNLPNKLFKVLRKQNDKSKVVASENEQKVVNENIDAFLYDISIENNTITNMGLSGIGMPELMLSIRPGIMISVDGLLIRENFITNCSNQIPEKKNIDLTNTEFGGIVLSAAENVIISQNRIEGNGNEESYPVCGILIRYGENVEICDNRILNNGPVDNIEGKELKKGLRGGIVVNMSFKMNVIDIINNIKKQRADGIPAVKVHDNSVTQPLGQALIIVVMGPVSVVGNRLTSQGVNNNPFTKDMPIAAAMIFNFNKLLVAYKAQLRNNMMLYTTNNKDQELNSSNLPGCNVLFSNNQITLIDKNKNQDCFICAQFITGDDIAYNNNQSNCSIFNNFITDVFLLGGSIRANSNRFEEDFDKVFCSLLSGGEMITAALNQSTHCLFTFAPNEYRINKENIVFFQQNCEQFHKKVISNQGK